MISFVWSSKYPFWSGNGGSERYTAGHIRELMRRGIPTRLLTLGHGKHDGRTDFPDITFQELPSKAALSKLDDTLVFVTYPVHVDTTRQSYAILHCPGTSCAEADPLFDAAGATDKTLITPSRFAAHMWGTYFGRQLAKVPVVYPFAEACFGQVARPKRRGAKTRILFAGRLTPDKGIYTLLASLHMGAMRKLSYRLSVTTACSHPEEGKIIRALVEAHPLVDVVPAQRTPEDMARLMAQYDVVVIPSTNLFWKEAFGIISVEAQHAGCRVVASNGGGLPETDCGGLILVDPDNPEALAEGIAKAASLGPLTAAERALAATKFTVKASVDALLQVIADEGRQAMQKVQPRTGAGEAAAAGGQLQPA